MAQWSVPLARVAEKQMAQIETVARVATFKVMSKVDLKSPVDTGRFRANWNYSEGAPNYTFTDSTAKSRGAAEAQRALTGGIGGIAYFSNGLPYASRLEYGWSKQAPSGMVRLSVAEFAKAINK